MNIEKQTRSQEFLVIRKTMVGGSSSQQFYKESSRREEDEEEPELMMYEMLRSLIRKQLRRPFHLLKELLFASEQEEDVSSNEVVHHHLRQDLELIAVNIRNVYGAVKQRRLLEGLLAMKSFYLWRGRVEHAYYSAQNMARMNMAMVLMQNVQRMYLKWEGFARLYENYKGMKLSKITLSKIEVVSNDLTKEFQDFNPFLQRGREIEAINSYIIDRSSENDRQRQLDDSEEGRDHVPHFDQQQQSIEKHFFARDARREIQQVHTREKHSSLTEKWFVSREKSEQQLNSGVKVNEFVAQSSQKRQLKKSSTAYYAAEEERQEVVITQRKQGEHEQGRGTQRREQGHHLYLIRDCRARNNPPTNFIKIPISNSEVKIVQIQAQRKKSSRQRVVRAEVEVEREICENCKFCLQMKERKEIMQAVQQRLQSLRLTSSTSTQIYSK